MPSINFQDPYAAGRAFQGASDTVASAGRLQREREEHEAKLGLIKAKAIAESEEAARLKLQREALADFAKLRIADAMGQKAELAGGPSGAPEAEERFQRIRDVAQRLIQTSDDPLDGQRLVSQFLDDEKKAIAEEQKQKALGKDAERLQAAMDDGLFADEAMLEDAQARMSAPDYEPGTLSKEIGAMRSKKAEKELQEEDWAKSSELLTGMIAQAPDRASAGKATAMAKWWWENRREVPVAQAQRAILDTLYPDARMSQPKTPRDQAIEIAVKEGRFDPERVAEIESFLVTARNLPPIAQNGTPAPAKKLLPPLKAEDFKAGLGMGVAGGSPVIAGPVRLAQMLKGKKKAWEDRTPEERERDLARVAKAIGNPRVDLEKLLTSIGVDPKREGGLPPEIRAALGGGEEVASAPDSP